MDQCQFGFWCGFGKKIVYIGFGGNCCCCQVVIVSDYYCFNVYFLQLGEMFFNVVFNDIFEGDNIQYVCVFYDYQWCCVQMCYVFDVLFDIGGKMVVIVFDMMLNCVY